MASVSATLVNAGDRFHIALDPNRSLSYCVMVAGVYTGGTIGFYGSPQGDVAPTVAGGVVTIGGNYIPLLGDPMDYNSPTGAENQRVLTANEGASWVFNPPYGAFTDFEAVAVTALGGSLSLWFFPFSFPLNVTVSSDQVPSNPITLLQGIYWGLEELRLLTAQGLNVSADYKENFYKGSTNTPTFNN